MANNAVTPLAPPPEENERRPTTAEPAVAAIAPPPEEGEPGPRPNIFSDVGRSLASGAAKGAIGLPGAVGSTGQLIDFVKNAPPYLLAHGAELVGALPKGKTAEQLLKAARPDESENEEKGYVNKILGVPFITSSGMVEVARRKGAQFYDPQNTLGRMAGDTAETVVGSLVSPGSIYQRILGGLGAGIGSSGLGELTRGTRYEGPARFIGGLLGQVPSAIVSSRLPGEVAKRAEDVAARVAKEAVPDPKDIAKNIKVYLQGLDAEPYVPGVKPTTAQATRSGQLQSLENAIQKETGDAGIYNQKSASEQSRLVAADRTLADVDQVRPNMSSIFGIETDAQNASSISAKSNILKIEESLAKNEKDAWNKLREMDVQVSTKNSIPLLKDYVSNLSVVSKSNLPSWINKTISDLESSYGAGKSLPIDELQGLRSMVLAEARKAYTSPTPVDAKSLYGFAEKLAEILQNKKNLSFVGATPTSKRDAVKLWEEARSSTKNYHDVFGQGVAEKLIAGDKVGNPKISGEGALQNILSGPEGPEKLRQVRAIPGADIDQNVSDWMIGKLTANGMKVDLKPLDVDKFISNASNQAIVSQIPGLEQRLVDIAAGSRTKQIADNFDRALQRGDAAVLSDFINANKGDLRQIFPDPAKQKFIDQLGNSSAVVSKIQNEGLTNEQALKLLKENDILTLLYGRVAGAVPSVALGAAAGTMTSVPGGHILGTILSPLLRETSKAATNLLIGDVRGAAYTALNRAAVDPAFMARLLQKPTPSNLDAAARALTRGGYRAALATQKQTSEASGGRITRATGGRTGMDHVAKAVALVKMAERAKKMHSNHTEQLLDVPDESIAAALKVANRAI